MFLHFILLAGGREEESIKLEPHSASSVEIHNVWPVKVSHMYVVITFHLGYQSVSAKPFMVF